MPPESWASLKVWDWVAGTVKGGGITFHSVRVGHPWETDPETALRLFGSLVAADSVDRGNFRAQEQLSEQLSAALCLGSLIAMAVPEDGEAVQLLPSIAWRTLRLDIATQTASDDESRFIDVGILSAAYTPAVLPNPPWFIGEIADDEPGAEKPKSGSSPARVGEPGEAKAKRRGPKGGLTATIAATMLSELRAGIVSERHLDDEKELSLALRFSASRDTVTKARKAAITEYRREFDNSTRDK